MAIISAFTIIRALSLAHITLGWQFLFNPRVIADQNVVYILGEAMKLAHVTDFDKASPATAFLGVLFAFLGVSDLISVSMHEPLAVEYWGNVAPMRLLFLFPLTAYTYLAKPSGNTYTWSAKGDGVESYSGKFYKACGAGGNLQNGMIFTWAFLELIMWFWVYLGLRDQRRQAAMKVLERRQAEEGML